MSRSWSAFESPGASTSPGSAIDRVVETDASQHILPSSFRFGESPPKSCMLFIRGLLRERKTYVRRLLYDARRRHPSPGPTITDFYMDCELPQDATLIRIWRPNGEVTQTPPTLPFPGPPPHPSLLLRPRRRTTHGQSWGVDCRPPRQNHMWRLSLYTDVMGQLHGLGATVGGGLWNG